MPDSPVKPHPLAHAKTPRSPTKGERGVLMLLEA